MADRAPDPDEREGEVMTSAGTRPQVAARAVKGIVDWLRDGSVEGVLVGMVDTRMLDGAALQRLARRIGKAKKTGTKTETKEDAQEGAER